MPAPAPIPADSPEAAGLQPIATTGPISADSPEAAALVSPGSVATPLPADTPALVSHEDYLKQLPRGRIEDEYLADVAKGGPVDKETYYRAYRARAREGNLFGDAELSPESKGPGFVSSVLDTAKMLDVGLFAQGNELGKFLTGIDFAGMRKVPEQERRASIGNVVTGSEVAFLRTANMLRQAATNIANHFWRSDNFAARKFGVKQGQDNAYDNEEYDKQFETSIAMKKLEEDLVSGKADSQKNTRLAQTLDPETVKDVSQSPLSDPSILLPGLAAAKPEAAAIAGAAVNLEKSAVEGGIIRKTIARPIELAANATRAVQNSVDTSPLLRAATAGGITLAVGGDTPMAVLAGMVGASSKHLDIAQSLLGGAEASLRKTAGQIAGRLPPGPMGQFAGKTFLAMSNEGKALLLSQAANLPFLLGSENEDDFKNNMLVGLYGHGIGTAVKGVNSLNFATNFWKSADHLVAERMPVKDYGITPGLDKAHAETVKATDNTGNNFVQSMRNYFGKRSELYVLRPEHVEGALAELQASGAKLADDVASNPKAVAQQNGVTNLGVEMPDGSKRNIALVILRDGVPGLGAGHEVGHLIESASSPEELRPVYDAITQAYGEDGIARAKESYQRQAAASGQPFQDLTHDQVVSELFAENASAVLNAIPIGEFGPEGFKGWRKTARNIYATVERALNKIGAKVPETDGTGAGPKTGLGYDPSAPVGQLVENLLEAKRIEQPLTEAEARQESPIENAREIAPEPRFAKGDPLDSVHSTDGTLIAKDAKITKVLGDVNGTHFYEIEYTDPVDGKRKAGNVPENFLYSPVKAGAGSTATPKTESTTFPKSPVTSNTPEGVATPGAATPEATVTPVQVQNVTKPEGPANVRVTPPQQATFAAKATPEVQKQNLSTLKQAENLPRHERPVLETDYYAAKSDTFGPDAVVRKEQRRLADNAERTGKPNPLRKLYQKVFVPYKLIDGPRPRVFGFSMDKFIQNVDILKGWLHEEGNKEGVAELSDPQFANDVRTYLENQANGFAGDGRRLERPADTKPGTVTPENRDYSPVKLDTTTAGVINLLLGLPLPETSTPANRYFQRFAELNGLKPELYDSGTAETNPIRKQAIERGFNPKLLNSVVENLPVENFTTPLKVRKDLNFPAGDTAFAQAGFMPGRQKRLDTKNLTTEDFTSGPERLDKALRRSGWAILTGTQEKNGAHTTPENIGANAALKAELEQRGIPHIEVGGRYKGEDQGSNQLILADETTARELAAKYGQETVLTKDGLVNPEGNVVATTDHSKNAHGAEARQQDFHSVLPDGSAFTQHLDFDKNDLKFMPGVPVQHKGKPLEHAIREGTMNLVHFGGSGLRDVDPKNFGKSGMTSRAELSGLPRTYFYEQGKINPTDPVAKRPNQYGAKVDAGRIYDGDTDALNYAASINREKSDQMLVDAGYVGIARTRDLGKGKEYRQVELFKPTKVTPIDSPSSKFMPAAPKPGAEEWITHAALEDGQGKIHTGRTHSDIFERHFRNLLGERNGTFIERDGFVTNKNRFVPRDEAMQIAEKAGQLDDPEYDRTAKNLEYPREQGLEGHAFQAGRKFMPQASPAQEKVFKDSKVRDENGNLKPVFHGTYSDFKKFKIGGLGFDFGAHFGTAEQANARIGHSLADLTPEISGAEHAFDAFPEVRENLPPSGRGQLEALASGSRQLPVFLDIKNPLRMPDVGPWGDPEQVLFKIPRDVLKKLPKSVGDAVDAFTAFQQDYAGPTSKYEAAKGAAAKPALEAIKTGLQELGYDGIVYRNEFEATPNESPKGPLSTETARAIAAREAAATNDSYIAFENKQIMPAFAHDAKARFMPAVQHELPMDIEESANPRELNPRDPEDVKEARRRIKTIKQAKTHQLSSLDLSFLTREERGLLHHLRTTLDETSLASQKTYTLPYDSPERHAAQLATSNAYNMLGSKITELEGKYTMPEQAALTGWQAGSPTWLDKFKADPRLPVALEKVFDSAPKYEGKVYRGLKDLKNFGDFASLQPGEVVHIAPSETVSSRVLSGSPRQVLPYISTSAQPWTAGRFARASRNGGAFLELKVNSGRDVADLLRKASGFKFREKEVVLKEGASFKIDKVEKTDAFGRKKAYITATEIPEKFAGKALFMPAQEDVRETRTYKNIAKHLTPEEAKDLRSDTAQRLVDLYHELPKDEDFEAAAQAGLAKKGWYQRAADTLQTIFGEDTERFVSLLAATSPRQTVQDNLPMALKIWADWEEAGRPLDKETLQPLIEEHAEMHSRVPNSIRALQGYETATPPLSSDSVDSKAQLSGPKVESFRRNLLGDLSQPTNDAWMAMFSNIDQSKLGTKSGYLAMNAKVRKVAEKLGLHPAEVQETVWSFFKTLTEATKVDKTAKEALRSLSDSDILNTPEFHDEILHNPRIKAQLERLGFTGFDSLQRGADSSRVRQGSLADVAAQEGGTGRLRVLDRIAGRAQRLKDAELAATRETLAESKPANPFMPGDLTARHESDSDHGMITKTVAFRVGDEDRTRVIDVKPVSSNASLYSYLQQRHPGKAVTVLDVVNPGEFLRTTDRYKERFVTLPAKDENSDSKFMPGAAPRGSSPELPRPGRLAHFDDESNKPRRALEDETTRHASYNDGINGGIVLHSAKKRSTGYLNAQKAAAFRTALKAAKTVELRDHLIESYF